MRYTCEQCEINTSMEKIEQHMIDEHDNTIQDEYLEPDLSYKDGRVKCNECGKDFIKILEGVKHALKYHDAQQYIENRWNMKTS